MKGFSANYDSSPASTPNDYQKRSNAFENETPQLASTTPLAPPPSHPFGSSQFGSGVGKLQFPGGSDKSPRLASPAGRSFKYSTNTQDTYDEREDEGYSQELDENAWNEGLRPAATPSFGISSVKGRTQQPERSLMRFSPGSARKSPLNVARRWSRAESRASDLPQKGDESFVPGLARDLAKRTPPAKLANDPDDITLGTEQVLRELDEEGQNNPDDSLFPTLVGDGAEELENLWNRAPKSAYSGLEVGPRDTASPFEHARFVAGLILRLYNPHLDEDSNIVSLPERLLGWLNTYHSSYDVALRQIVNTSPNPTANELFWEVVENLTARGRFQDVLQLLGEADFAQACLGTEYGVEEANYNGAEQQAIETAVYRARQVLNACPAYQNQDWNFTDQEWGIYRKEIENAFDDLTELANTSSFDESLSQRLPTMSSFGSSRKQGKGLPFEVYGHLKTVYSILLGSAADIISISNDWLEASVLLTVWWNSPPRRQVARWSFDVSRASHPNHGQTSYMEDGDYLQRLKESFLAVTDPNSNDSFQLNSMSPTHLATGAVLQGDLASALGVLQTLSLCITAATSEMGTWRGWLDRAVPSAEGLDRDDLMVLTNGASASAFRRDEILERYAVALFQKQELHTADGVTVEGWELAFSVASRMEDNNVMKSTISAFLEELPVTREDRAERLVTLCGELGLTEESRKVSENFGDYLVNNTTNYGMALLCYARSHSESKVRQLIDLLNSYCLVQSKAYPLDEDLDPSLRHLVSKARSALSGIAEVDPKAVQTLQFYLVGYACLRRFYSLRDDVAGDHLLDRKKAAAKALLAAINSAADSIYGGLYDPGRQSAIQVDGLLTLLGESTVFMEEDSRSGQRILSSDQMYAILAAIEDLQTVSDRVYSTAEECLEAALRNYHGSLPPSPHAMLKKSVSSGTNSNFSFSMMGSEMLARSEESLGTKSLGSAVLVGSSGKLSESIHRGWDWRARFKEPNTTGDDVLRYLRVGLLNGLSITSLEEQNKT